MEICRSTDGDFVVWREQELIVERIHADPAFIECAFDQATQLNMH